MLLSRLLVLFILLLLKDRLNMGKCKFREKWTDEPEFKPWLRAVAGNDRQAYCSLCKKTISITWMGLNAVRSHMQSASHISTTRRGE